MKFGVAEEVEQANGGARFIVFGVGGGGGNAVEHMVRQNISGVTFVATNTDAQALEILSVPNRFQFGEEGLGVGGIPERGRELAEENQEEIRSLLAGYNMVFITAGMGGGTGTGAAPVIARIAKEMGILTVAVVTKPFKFEGGRRMKSAQEGIRELSQYVDSIITIPNETLLQVYRNMNMDDAFKKADDVLLHAVQGIIETVRSPGKINVDFRDVCTAMQSSGYAMMGIGRASGEDRAVTATEKATRSPLLDNLRLENAKGMIVSIKGSRETILLGEPQEVADMLGQLADLEDGDIFYGVVYDESMGDELQVTIIATGLEIDDRPKVTQKPPADVYATPHNYQPPLAEHVPQQMQERPAPTPRSVSGNNLNVGDYLKNQHYFGK